MKEKEIIKEWKKVREGCRKPLRKRTNLTGKYWRCGDNIWCEDCCNKVAKLEKEYKKIKK